MVTFCDSYFMRSFISKSCFIKNLPVVGSLDAISTHIIIVDYIVAEKLGKSSDVPLTLCIRLRLTQINWLNHTQHCGCGCLTGDSFTS